MSFGGGGREQYILEYVVKVTNQGGAGGISQVNTGFQQMNSSMQHATASAKQLEAAHNRVSQANLAVTKGLKGMAFGFIGMTTAGAEMVGMMSMYGDVQKAVKEAQQEQSEALKEGGKESKAYKDATQEVIKVNRWAQMTFRNLMLSIFDMVPFIIMAANSTIKWRKAIIERNTAAKAEQALIKSNAASNLQLAGSNAAVTSSTIAGTGAVNARIASTRLFTAAQAQQSVATVTSTGAFTNQAFALGTGTTAMNAATVAAGRLTKAIRVLQIATKVLIPLIALEVGAQAFENNWGGFADKINAVGKAIGDTIPQLKGMLGWVDKIGRSIVAIFTGNFDRIGSIWNPVTEGSEEAVAQSDEVKKAIEEAAEKLKEFRDQAMSTLFEFATADKKERKEWLVKFGIKDKGKGIEKDFKGLRKILDNASHEMEQASAKFDLLEGINILESLDLEHGLDQKTISKIRSTLGSDFQDMFKGDNDVFSQLGDIMKKNSGETREQFNKSVAEFFADNPGLMTALEKIRPDLAERAKGFLASYAEDVQKIINSGTWWKDIEDNPNPVTQGPSTGGLSVDEQLAKARGESGKTGSGLLDNIVTKLENEVKALPGKIKAMDWNAAGTALRDQLIGAVSLIDPQAIGNAIHTYIIKPAYNFAYPFAYAIAQGIKDGWAQFVKDPIGSIMGTANAIGTPIGEFVSGLLGYESESAMYDEWSRQLDLMATHFWQLVRDNFDKVEETKNDPGSGGVDVGQGVWFKNWTDPIFTGIANAYAQLMIDLNEDPNVQQFRRWFHDPVGALLTLIKTLGDIAEATKAAEEKPMEVYTIDQFLKDSGIQGWIDKLPTLAQIGEYLSGLQVIKDIIGLYNAAKKGGWEFLKYIWDLGGKISLNQAEGATGSNDTKGIDPTGLNLDDILDLSGTVNMTVPEIIVNGKKYTSAPLPAIINPPLGTNATPTPPTITTENGIIKPSTLTPDISSSTIQSISDGPSKEGSGWPGAWGPTYALYIDYTGTAIVKPQSVSYDISQSKITSVSTGGEDDGSGTKDVLVIAVETARAFKGIGQAFDEMVMGKITTGLQALKEQFTKDFNQMTQNAAGVMNNLGSHWSMHANKMGANAESAGNQIRKAFASALQDVYDTMEDLAKQWSKFCNSMGANARSAVKQILSAFNKIPKKIVTIHEIKTIRTGGSLAKGGLLSLAEGGVISAAGGRMLTTNGPTYLVGDNPGGKESIWAIPHNNPGPTVRKIEKAHGIGSGGGRSTELNQTINLNIKGTDIISDTKLTKKIKMTMGENRDRFG